MDIREANQMSASDEKRHWWMRTRFFYLREAAELAQSKFGAVRALEVGCGTAQNLSYLREDLQPSLKLEKVVGIEPALSEPTARYDWMKPADSIVRSLDSVSEKFDFLIAMDVLEHVDQPLETLREWVSHLKPGAVVLITVPAFQWLWSVHDEILHHKKRYTKSELHEVGVSAGLKPLSLKYIFGPAVPIFYVLRKLMPQDPAKAETGLKPGNPFVNGCLTAFGRVEHAMGGNPFFGTSVVGLFEK